MMRSEVQRMEILDRYAAGETSTALAEEYGIPAVTIRRWASEERGREAVSPETTAFTRRCRNKHCINRFVPVNTGHFFCSDCQGLRRELSDGDLWSQDEILQEEGSLTPGASHLEMAKRAFGQKNHTLRENSRLRSLREYLNFEVRSYFDENPDQRFPLVAQPAPSGGKGERELILVCSDWQIGKLEEGIGVKAMEEERIPRIMDATRQITEHFRRSGYELDRARVVFGGDMIEGCYIYGGQNVSGLDRTGNTHRITRQIALAAHLQASVVADLASYFHKVEVDAVPGNHGRTNGRNDYSDPNDSFDTMSAAWARDKAGGIPHVDWHIHDDDWWGAFESLGHYVVAIHGDQWKGPLVQIEKLLPQWVTGETFERKPELLITCHRHDFATMRVNGIHVVQNGTIDGGSNWYRKAFGKTSEPTQTIVIMSRQWGVEAIYPLYVAKKGVVIA